MDGSISTVRIHSRQGTQATSLCPEPGDEKAAGAVDVRQCEQELRPERMPKLRPFVAERRVDGEPGRFDNGFVFVRIQRTSGVDDRSAGADSVGGRLPQRKL